MGKGTFPIVSCFPPLFPNRVLATVVHYLSELFIIYFFLAFCSDALSRDVFVLLLIFPFCINF